MNSHETIHKLIESSNRGNREIDRAVARYLGWYRITPSEGKYTGAAKRGGWIHPDDCHDRKPFFDGFHGTDVYRDVPDFSTSCDTLKAIRPEVIPFAWVFLWRMNEVFTNRRTGRSPRHHPGYCL
jgi:hypothetical protein